VRGGAKRNGGKLLRGSKIAPSALDFISQRKKQGFHTYAVLAEVKVHREKEKLKQVKDPHRLYS